MRSSRLFGLCAIAGTLVVAYEGGDALAGAGAAAAGTLVEAAPFLFLAEVLGRVGTARFGQASGVRLEALARLAGCGCSGGPVPGALALPALALCWLAFGPLVTLARAAAGLLVIVARRRARPAHRPLEKRRAASPSEPDPLADLAALGVSAFLAALALPLAAQLATAVPPAAFVLGVAVGVLAPCATAGVAIAAACSHGAPLLTVGILVSSGLARLPQRLPWAADESDARAFRHARTATAALALALGLVALRQPGGLINPRLFVPVAAGSALALTSARRARTRSIAPGLVPALILAVVAVPPPPPRALAVATQLGDASPGERLAFTGVAHDDGGATLLVRFAITCCRIDATAVAVRLDRRLPGPSGRWRMARGTLVRDRSGELVLHATDIRAIAPPADPFIYR